MNKGKIRTRRLTIRAKILIPSVIIVVLVCGLMGYNSYTRFEESMVRMGVEEADMVATIVVDSLDANLVSEVTVGSEGTQVYQMCDSSVDCHTSHDRDNSVSLLASIYFFHNGPVIADLCEAVDSKC